jgi:hypothetical protein
LGKHPLIELATSREVRQSAGFGAVAADLTGEKLAALFQQEVAAAPRRHQADKKYFVAYNRKLAAERKPSRDSEHAALALANRGRAGQGIPLPIPGDDVAARTATFLQAILPLKSEKPDPALGADDPNFGVDRIDLIGVGPAQTLAVAEVRYLAPSAKRVPVGDTPLRALLQGLANCAIALANRDALKSELPSGTELAEGPPRLLLIGSPRYWELSRRRHAQKGAAWIKELERLADEVKTALGIEIHYLSLRLEGDPGWSYEDGQPTITGTPLLVRAWEGTASRVKPRSQPRPKAAAPAEVRVEADLSRPIQTYSAKDSYKSGDRIQHPTLGIGVVQGGSGAGKILVLFEDGRRATLVHARAAAAEAPAARSPLQFR